jgi:hypothetical protein
LQAVPGPLVGQWYLRACRKARPPVAPRCILSTWHVCFVRFENKRRSNDDEEKQQAKLCKTRPCWSHHLPAVVPADSDYLESSTARPFLRAGWW